MLWVYIKITLYVSIRMTRCINRNMNTSPSDTNDARDHFNIKGNVSKYKRAITVDKTASKQQIWWRHEREHFLRYWPFVLGIHRGFLSQKSVTRIFDIFSDPHLHKRLSKQ